MIRVVMVWGFTELNCNLYIIHQGVHYLGFDAIEAGLRSEGM